MLFLVYLSMHICMYVYMYLCLTVPSFTFPSHPYPTPLSNPPSPHHVDPISPYHLQLPLPNFISSSTPNPPISSRHPSPIPISIPILYSCPFPPSIPPFHPSPSLFTHTNYPHIPSLPPPNLPVLPLLYSKTSSLLLTHSQPNPHPLNPFPQNPSPSHHSFPTNTLNPTSIPREVNGRYVCKSCTHAYKDLGQKRKTACIFLLNWNELSNKGERISILIALYTSCKDDLLLHL